MDADAIIAAKPIVTTTAPIVATAAPNLEPPPYDIDYDTATAAIGMLPSLHPRPSYANIGARLASCLLIFLGKGDPMQK